MVSQKMLAAEENQINLNALKNQDPFAKKILDSALRVAIYKFLSKKNEWQKLDYQGSLFVFERMFEPIHSLAVMNTLALDLFLQPLTYDLEFQDRNPFLLYKSNNDIYGIWFIDGNDCERIKNLIVNLTDQAKERRTVKRDKKVSLLDKLNDTASGSSYDLQQLTPIITSASNIITNAPSFSNNNKDSSNVDIMQMLAKAQNNYIQSKSNLNESSSNNLTEQPKPIGNWPNDYHLNTATYVKPEPRRLTSIDNNNPVVTGIVSPTSSTSSKSQEASVNMHSKSQQQPVVPIIQRLLSLDHPNTPATSSNIIKNTINQNETSFTQQTNENSTHDLISLELKRKLNILKPTTTTTETLMTPATLATTTTTAATNKLPFTTNTFSPINNSKTLMTVSDFEANILSSGEATNNTHGMSLILNENFNNESQNKSQPPLFYLGQNQSYSTIRPNKLSLVDLNENNDKPKFKQQRSSNSESSHESSGSPVLPLLLTPAAFESTTQNTFFNNTNPLIMTTTTTTNTLTNENNNILKLTNPTTTTATSHQQNIESFDFNQNNDKNKLLLTKSQLQQILIHLLKNDEQFINTIHEAYTSNFLNKKL